MNFISNAYEVEIWEGGKKIAVLPINDATSTFRAIKLAEMEDRIVKLVKDIQPLTKQVLELYETTKDTNIGDLTEEQNKIFIEYKETQTLINKCNADYLRLMIPDCSKYETIIDSVRGDSNEAFYGAIKRASFGMTDKREDSKKKIAEREIAWQREIEVFKRQGYSEEEINSWNVYKLTYKRRILELLRIEEDLRHYEIVARLCKSKEDLQDVKNTIDALSRRASEIRGEFEDDDETKEPIPQEKPPSIKLQFMLLRGGRQ
jgi:hypothetical protein